MYQHVMICGNLGKDPEVRGTATTFSVAVSDRRKVDGEWVDATEWFRCVVFGRQAEILAADARKGDKVLVEGKMRTSSWVDRASGETKYKTELVALFVRQLKGRGASAQPQRSAPADEGVPF